MRSYLDNIAYNFAAQGICLFAGLVSNILVARLLGPEGKGVVVLLANYISIVVIIFMFGMSEGNVFYISKKSYTQSSIISTNFVHTIIITIIFVICSLLIKDLLLVSVLKGVQNKFFYLSLLLFPLQFIFLHCITMLQGFKLLKEYSLSFVIRALALLLMQVILVPIWNVAGAVIALILSVFSAIIFSLIRLFRNNFSLGIPNLKFFKDSLFFGVKSQIGLLLNFFERRLDYFFVNIFLEPIQVGFYSVAVIVAELPWYFPNAVGTVIFPEITSKEKSEAYRFVAFICRNTIVITLFIAIVVGILANILIKIIFGPRFMPAIIPLQLLLPGIIFLAINRVICVGFSGTGRPELGTLTVVFSFITTVVLDLLLIPRIGIRGAALASSFSYFTSALAGLIIFKKISHLRFSDLLLFKPADLKKYGLIKNWVLKRWRK